MKKIVALTLALLMVIGLTAIVKPAAAEEETVLKLWCIATESDANRPAYLQAIADYEAAHPGVKIEMEAFENESYKTKIKAAMMGGDTEDLPDIFFSWSGGFLGEFVNAGRVVCLDEYFKAYADKLPESMLSTTTYEGKHYGVPTTFNIVAMYANMDLLAEVGYDHVPQTYEDLTACCDALLAKGIIPFGCAGKETWCVTEYLEPIIIKTIGYEALGKIFAGEATWNDPDIATAVTTFQEMIKRVTSIPPAPPSATTRPRPTSWPARPPSIRTVPGTPAKSPRPISSLPSACSRS